MKIKVVVVHRHKVMKVYVGVRIKLHAFPISVLD
jgi:hypothetical protein